MIYTFSYLGLIDEPDLAESAYQFDKSGFEIYSTRELIKVEYDIATLSRDMQSRLSSSEVLDLLF